MASIDTLPAPDLSSPLDDAWKREQSAFHQLLPGLLLTHLGEFVAIHEGRVIESGSDKVRVARRAYKRFGYIPIFISWVATAPPAPLRVPSPRRLDGP